MRSCMISVLRTLCIGLLLCLTAVVSQGQTLNVVENDGSQTDFTIENLRKICFSNGDMIVVENDNNESIFDLSEMRKLMFSDFGSSIEEILPTGALCIFPNPVSDVVYVDLSCSDVNTPSGEIHVLNLQGRIVITQEVSSPGILPLDVSTLKPGIYLCRFVSTSVTKSVKIIKQ